jgi:hypothetical protein
VFADRPLYNDVNEKYRTVCGLFARSVLPVTELPSECDPRVNAKVTVSERLSHNSTTVTSAAALHTKRNEDDFIQQRESITGLW